MGWWNALTGLEQALAAIGVFAFLAFFIQTLVSLVGGLDADMGETGDIDGGGGGGQAGSILELFAVRNLLSFLTGFSWTTLGFVQLGLWPIVAFCLGVLAGSFLSWLNILMLAGISMLASRGNIDTAKAVGRTGWLSLGIAAGQGSLGKVTLVIGERQVELLARSVNGAAIDTNSPVKIVARHGDTALVAPA